jgi:hypothetical protein
VVAPARTDIVGFVGIAVRGPLHQPTKVESWAQFTSIFGAHTPQGYLAYAVEGFFNNGGQTCWVVRVANPDDAASVSWGLTDTTGRTVLNLTAYSQGVWGQELSVSPVNIGSGRFSLTFRLPDGTQEYWPNLSFLKDDPRFVTQLLNDPINGSKLVHVISCAAQAPGSPAPLLRSRVYRLTDGCDGLAHLSTAHLTGEEANENQTWGLATLQSIDEVAVVAIPDIMPTPRPTGNQPSPPPIPACSMLNGPAPRSPAPLQEPEFPPGFDVRELQNSLVRHCEKLKDRIAILDARPDNPVNGLTGQVAFRAYKAEAEWRPTPEAVLVWRQDFDTSYAALYFPWLKVPDPLSTEGRLWTVPPCGHVAGVYARVEQQVGVHKPPANEVLEGVEDVSAATDDTSHGLLNDQGINVIRSFNGRRIRIAGARTLSSDPLWQYVNVRRLFLMIERAINSSTQWTVFEPNNPTLWLEIDRAVRSFMESLWRRGFLDGASREEAYSVRCDASTNPPWETDNGRAICEVGLLPPWPAEFVLLRIGITPSGAEILNAVGAANA